MAGRGSGAQGRSCATARPVTRRGRRPHLPGRQLRRLRHAQGHRALAQVDAQPWKGGRKGPDGGIDGIIYFKPDGKRMERAIVEVKGGGTGVKDIGRLVQVMQRERAPIVVGRDRA